jgi:DNA-binding IclR family transcriptional regulator
MAEQDMQDSADYMVPALQRGLRILELFDARTRVLSMNEIAEAMGVSVSTIYRIVQTLHTLGYLQKLGKNNYELGPQVISRGFSYMASRDIVDIAMPHLMLLRDRTSLSCHLSIREQTETLYVYRAFAAQRLSVNIPIGTRIPCHCNAMGRVLLTSLNDAELEKLYQHVRLDDYLVPGPRTLPELQQNIRQVEKDGWVISRSDYATAIAAPVRNHLNQVVAAINLSAPDAFMTSPETQLNMRDMLLQCSRQISAELGHQTPV